MKGHSRPRAALASAGPSAVAAARKCQCPHRAVLSLRELRERGMARTWLPGGSVELLIRASPDQVYDAIADVTAVGDRSLECRRCDWLPGSTPGSLGARFGGRNRANVVARWSRVCEVTTAEPGKAFAFRTLPETIDITRRDSTTWG